MTISEVLKGKVPCPHRVLHALDDTNDLCAAHMGANSPSAMRALKKATSVTLTIVRYVEDHPDTGLPGDDGLSQRHPARHIKAWFHCMPDVMMEEWNEEEWAWFLVIFLYMISEHLPKVSESTWGIKIHYKLHPVNALAFGEKVVDEMADIAECFSMGKTPPAAGRKYRLGSVASSLSVADQRRICDMIVKIASADEGLAEEVNIFDYALRASREIRGSVPQALREVFKRYNITIPEMVEAGVVGRCATCGTLENRDGPKLLICSGCRDVKYCNRDCQKAHWKEHKALCQGYTT